MSLNMLEGYKPSDFGLDGYAEYRKDPVTGREVQLEAIEFGAYCEQRVAGVAAPTGIGKSLVALSIAKLTGLRTVILTATKGLQDQYARDAKYGVVDIRGKANYDCADFTDLDCRGGATMGCRYTNGKGCEYERGKAAARNAAIVSANYAYWFAVNDKAQGLKRTEAEEEVFGENPVEMLILDEGHAAPELLAGYLGVKVYEGEIKKWEGSRSLGEDVEGWKTWLRKTGAAEELDVEIAKLEITLGRLGRKATKLQVETLHKMERLSEKLERISGMQGSEWVCEKEEGTRFGRQWGFDVVWPGRYAEQYLFCGVPKIVVMSATLRPKTLGLLGVRRENFGFMEWPRVFPANRHPIYSFPASHNGKDVRVDNKTSPAQLMAWVERIDEIIAARGDRKGIIQTVSYDRQKFLMEHSRHREIMLGNTSDPESESAGEIAETFRKAPAPAVLISPSFATGWDFAGEACEYVIVCKVPFKPQHGKVAKAREQRDEDYGMYQAMIELVQSAGRGMRSAEDRCEVFVVDSHVGWFVAMNKALAPAWFVQALRKIGSMPKAPPKL